MTKNEEASATIDLLRLVLGKLIAVGVERLGPEAQAKAKAACSALDAKARFEIELPGPHIRFSLGDEELFRITGANIGDLSETLLGTMPDADS